MPRPIDATRDRTRPTDRPGGRRSVPDAHRKADRASHARPARERPRAPVRPLVSLVIPAHNEEERLPGTLRRYGAALRERYGERVEILVVANGCTDRTAEVARRLRHELPGLRVIDVRAPIRKGGAILQGFREASGSARLFADADGATDPRSLVDLVDALDDADVAIGTRHDPDSVIVRTQPLRRRLLSRVFNAVIRVAFGLPFRDTQCGAKALRAEAVRLLAGRVEERDWTFDVDLLLSAKRLGLRIVERPVVWADIDGSRLEASRVAPDIGASIVRLWKREREADVRERRAERAMRRAREAAKQTGRALRRGTQRILALNWRDPRHPDAGGAELNLFEQARRWARDGHDVTVLAARRAGEVELPPVDTIDGVGVRRMGGRFTVYLHAAWYLLTRGHRHDRVLDVANGIPFFAPLFTGRPTALLVHHVHDRQWFAEFPRPVAAIGWFLERWVVPLVYRRAPTIAVSPTTREALLQTGFRPDRVHVVYNGVTVEQAPGAGRRRWTILYLGRIKRYKRLDRLIRAFAALRERFPDARLVIAGDGDARPELETLAADLGLEQTVEFLGNVDEATKARLLAEATVFATPSMQEGWGLSVIEANHHGTPAVAYDVPGLSAAIRPGETGLLAADDDGFCEALARLLEDDALRERLSAGARRWARRFSWETAAQQTFEILQPERADRTRPADDHDGSGPS